MVARGWLPIYRPDLLLSSYAVGNPPSSEGLCYTEQDRSQACISKRIRLAKAGSVQKETWDQLGE